MINQPDRILLVDDDSLGRLLTRSALEERGFQVCEAENGKDALDQIVSERPDMVLLDALMSGMDGFEVCQALRELPGASSGRPDCRFMVTPPRICAIRS